MAPICEETRVLVTLFREGAQNQEIFKVYPVASVSRIIKLLFSCRYLIFYT